RGRRAGKHVGGEIGGLGDNSAVTAGKQKYLAAASFTVNKQFYSQQRELNILAGQYERAIGPLDAYIGATLTEYDDLHGLRVALRASADAIGYKTGKERQSFAAAQQYIQGT